MASYDLSIAFNDILRGRVFFRGVECSDKVFQGKRIDFLFLCFIAITMHIDLISVSVFALNIAYTLYPCFAYCTTSHS
jgi:hypothetical protein